jgi:hypothetical protein
MKTADLDWQVSKSRCWDASPVRRAIEPNTFGVDGMICREQLLPFARALFTLVLILVAGGATSAQVSPTEISNPKLRAAEQEYLPLLQSLQQTISKIQFPLPFILTRYVGLDPERQASLDRRGLEFVYFHDRMLLKTSGFYTVSFNSEQLTPNERASRTFEEVIIPILQLITQELPSDAPCQGIGFEIAYHARAARKNSYFEGREILAVVLDRADALTFLKESENQRRQAILNRSGIYLDAKPFGLALGQKDALNLETLERTGSLDSGMATSFSSSAGARPPVGSPRYTPASPSNDSHAPSAEKRTANFAIPPIPAADSKPVASQSDAERLQAQHQAHLDALLKENEGQLHLVDYAPPSFAIYHKQLVLQLTLRNPLVFDKNTSSIYKRAAQSFDLFLGHELKALLPKLPVDPQVEALDFSLLNRLGDEKESSEAIEFVCPLKAITAFVEDEITGQALIDQSLVLVNGVRIELHLERVE